MSMGRNMLAGLANSVWSAMVGLAVVPFYLKYLGIEAYGLIGFFVTVQAVMSLLDMGLAPTISREVARCAVSGAKQEARSLLHTLAVIYFSMAGIIALLAYQTAPLIANHWLQASQLSNANLERVISLMGLVAACRWPMALYQGALIGMERITIASYINILITTLASFGGIGILAFVSPTLDALFIWQAGVACLHVATMRSAAWSVLGRDGDRKFDTNSLKKVWRFSAGVSGIALSAIILTQLDKLILSKMLGLVEFGYYMLATAVVSGLYFLITPVFNMIYPRFTSLVASGETDKLITTYRLGTRLFATVFFPMAMVLVVFGEDLVRLWTGNSALAVNVAPIMGLLALGSALHGVMYFPYALQLSYGMTHLPLFINATLMLVLIPLTIILTLSYGALGGAMAWVVFHVLYVLLGTWLTHRYLLQGLGKQWLLKDVGIPFSMTLIVGSFATFAMQTFAWTDMMKVIYGGILITIVPALSVVASPYFRKIILSAIVPR